MRGALEARINPLGLALSLLPVCFYVGYFGAGSGFLIMTVLALFGMEEMHQLNAMKGRGGLCLRTFVRSLRLSLRGAFFGTTCLVSDDLCRDRRMDRGSLRTANEWDDPARGGGGDGRCHRWIFLLEAGLGAG